MLFRKIQDCDLGKSGRFYCYSVAKNKMINFYCDRDNSVRTIHLVNADTDMIEKYNIRGLFYMENITVDNCELLKSDALIGFIAKDEA